MEDFNHAGAIVLTGLFYLIYTLGYAMGKRESKKGQN